VERPSAHHVLAGLLALEVCLLALAELVYIHGLREPVAGWRCAWSSVDAVWVWWGPGLAGVWMWLFRMFQLWEDVRIDLPSISLCSYTNPLSTEGLNANGQAHASKFHVPIA
jgi:hypothetical protein